MTLRNCLWSLENCHWVFFFVFFFNRLDNAQNRAWKKIKAIKRDSLKLTQIRNGAGWLFGVSFDFWRWRRWRPHWLIGTGWNDRGTEHHIDCITESDGRCAGRPLHGRHFLCGACEILHFVGRIVGDWNDWSGLCGSTNASRNTAASNDAFRLHDYLSIQIVHLKY